MKGNFPNWQNRKITVKGKYYIYLLTFNADRVLIYTTSNKINVMSGKLEERERKNDREVEDRKRQKLMA